MKEFKNGRYTVAGQGFLESTMIYPSVDSLIMSGESIARLDVKDQPKNEILLYKIKQFEESIIYFELSSKFADKTQQVKELRRHPNLNKNIKCLSDFLNTRKQNCEFIKTILKANNIRN